MKSRAPGFVRRTRRPRMQAAGRHKCWWPAARSGAIS